MIRATGGPRGGQREEAGAERVREPPLSMWSPGEGTPGMGSHARELVRGSGEKGTVWLWGSGQEALIHPKTRSAFFLTKNQGGKEAQE